MNIEDEMTFSISKHAVIEIIPEQFVIDESTKQPYLKIIINKSCFVGTPIESRLISTMNEILISHQEQLKKIFNEYNNQKGYLWFLFDFNLLCTYYNIFKNKEHISELLNFNTAEELFHNRNVGQMINIYESNGISCELLKQQKKDKVSDLLVNGINVEIKTIQPIRTIKILRNGIFIDEQDIQTLTSSLHSRIEKAIRQVPNTGCIFIFFWCNITNLFLLELLKGYYEPNFPTPLPNKIFLIYHDPNDNNSFFYTQLDYNSYAENIDRLNKILKQPLQLPKPPMGKLGYIELPFNPKGFNLIINCKINPGLNLGVAKLGIDPSLCGNQE